MKNLMLFVLLFTITLVCYSQKFLDIKYSKSFGGDYDDKVTDILTLKNNKGYLLIGSTNSKGNGGYDVWLIKLSTTGDIIWEKTYGHEKDEFGKSITEDANEGYLICGTTNSTQSGYKNVWVIKINAIGQLVWEKTFWGSDNDNAFDIISTPDFGSVVLASKESKADNDKDIWLIKLSKKGKMLWQSLLGERYIDDEAFSFVKTPDNGFMIAGYSNTGAENKEDIYIIKTDSRGTKSWAKKFGDIEKDEAIKILKTKDDRYIMAGNTESQGMGESDFYIMKMDISGKQLWEEVYGDIKKEQLTNMLLTNDNGILLVGNTNSKSTDEFNTYIVKLNKKGLVEWEKLFESEGYGSASSAVIIKENEYLLAGYSDKDKGDGNNADIYRFIDNSDTYITNYINKKSEEWYTQKQGETDQQYLNRTKKYSKGEVEEQYLLEARNTLLINKEKEVKSENVFRGTGNPLEGLDISDATKSMIVGNYYALIIGIDSYKGQWYPLNNAVRDAKAVERVLRSQYKFDYFRTLYDEEATRTKIINEFEWLVNSVKEEDNVFIYYSGHGEFMENLNKGYWVPIDAITNSMSAYISNSDIQTFLGGIRSKHTLLVSDACFSGDIFRGRTVQIPFEDTDRYYREVSSLPSRKAITSGGIEPVMDGGREGHSVFAYYFLKNLENNQHRFFDAGQLYEKIKIPIINNSEQSPQFNPIKNTGDEGGQFIFIRK